MFRNSSCRENSRVLLVVATVVTFLAGGPLLADSDQWKFTNKSGAHAKDLHLKWSRAVSWPGSGVPPQQPANVFAAAHGNGTNSTGLAQGQTGNGVPNNTGEVVLEFQYTGTKPVLKEAIWTYTNSTTEPSLHGMPPPIPLKVAPGKVNEWTMAPATGNGLLAVTIDRTQTVFQTTVGDSGIATAARFASFIDSLPFGDVMSLASNQVSYTGLSFSDDMPNIAVQILQQDSTQPLTVTTVPEPSLAWAAVFAGTILMRRRRQGHEPMRG